MQNLKLLFLKCSEEKVKLVEKIAKSSTQISHLDFTCEDSLSIPNYNKLSAKNSPSAEDDIETTDIAPLVYESDIDQKSQSVNFRQDRGQKSWFSKLSDIATMSKHDDLGIGSIFSDSTKLSAKNSPSAEDDIETTDIAPLVYESDIDQKSQSVNFRQDRGQRSLISKLSDVATMPKHDDLGIGSIFSDSNKLSAKNSPPAEDDIETTDIAPLVYESDIDQKSQSVNFRQDRGQRSLISKLSDIATMPKHDDLGIGSIFSDSTKLSAKNSPPAEDDIETIDMKLLNSTTMLENNALYILYSSVIDAKAQACAKDFQQYQYHLMLVPKKMLYQSMHLFYILSVTGINLDYSQLKNAFYLAQGSRTFEYYFQFNNFHDVPPLYKTFEKSFNQKAKNSENTQLSVLHDGQYEMSLSLMFNINDADHFFMSEIELKECIINRIIDKGTVVDNSVYNIDEKNSILNEDDKIKFEAISCYHKLSDDDKQYVRSKILNSIKFFDNGKIQFDYSSFEERLHSFIRPAISNFEYVLYARYFLGNGFLSKIEKALSKMVKISSPFYLLDSHNDKKQDDEINIEYIKYLFYHYVKENSPNYECFDKFLSLWKRRNSLNSQDSEVYRVYIDSLNKIEGKQSEDVVRKINIKKDFLSKPNKKNTFFVFTIEVFGFSCNEKECCDIACNLYCVFISHKLNELKGLFVDYVACIKQIYIKFTILTQDIKYKMSTQHQISTLTAERRIDVSTINDLNKLLASFKHNDLEAQDAKYQTSTRHQIGNIIGGRRIDVSTINELNELLTLLRFRASNIKNLFDVLITHIKNLSIFTEYSTSSKEGKCFMKKRDAIMSECDNFINAIFYTQKSFQCVYDQFILIGISAIADHLSNFDYYSTDIIQKLSNSIDEFFGSVCGNDASRKAHFVQLIARGNNGLLDALKDKGSIFNDVLNTSFDCVSVQGFSGCKRSDKDSVLTMSY